MKIVWFCASLEQKGGGERFVLEGTSALRKLGHDVTIVCDRLNALASFDGRYDLTKIKSTQSSYNMSSGYLTRIYTKVAGVQKLGRYIRQARPDIVICQSEYDAIKLYILSLLLNFRFRVFVFGQMYQFESDISRYASAFRKHLLEIVASRPGYRTTVKIPAPKLSPLVWIVNEAVSWLKYRAHRKAERIFTLSGQVAWEVSKLYSRNAIIARAAFDEDYIDRVALSSPRPVSAPAKFLSVSRLVRKKRIDLMIEAFARSALPATLTIIGTGDDESRLKAIAADCARRTDINFLGVVDDARVLAEVRAADCLLSLDIGDYDISVVEALGKGCRAIVARDFDLESFGAEFTGIVAVSPERDAVAAAIDNLPNMRPPSLDNLPTLIDQTWESLAKKIVA